MSVSTKSIKGHMGNESYKAYPDYGSNHPKQSNQEEKREIYMEGVVDTLKVVDRVMYTEQDLREAYKYGGMWASLLASSL